MNDIDEKASSRIAAATELLNRGIGKPVQMQSIELPSIEMQPHDMTSTEIIKMLSQIQELKLEEFNNKDSAQFLEHSLN